MSAGTTDVIVVGGGVIGASVTFHLAERGVKATLIERDDIASAGTGKSGALVRMHYTDPYQAKLAHESLPYFADWKNRVGAGDPGFVRTGVIVTAAEHNIPTLRANVKMLQRVGINTRVINGDDVARLQPWVDPEGLSVCGFEPDSGCAMPGQTARSFVEAAEQHGATIVRGQQVRYLLASHGRITGVRTDAGIWNAHEVIVCAGVWSVPLFAELGIDLPIRVNRTGAVLLERQGDVPMGPAGHMIFLDRAMGSYFRPYGETEILAGGGGRSKQTDSPDDYDENADEDFVTDIAKLVANRIPSMRGARMTGGWSGITDVTPDNCPILERNLGVDGLSLAAGFSGTGFKISPYVGKLMATWVVTSEQPEPATPFSFWRYENGAEIVPKNPYLKDGEVMVETPH